MRVATWLKDAPTTGMQMDGDTGSDDDQGGPLQKKHGLKSGKIRTADFLVTKGIRWPLEVVYNSQCQPTV